MPNNVLIKYGSKTTLTITGVPGLASDTNKLTGIETSVIDNTTDGFTDIYASGKITTGTSPTAKMAGFLICEKVLDRENFGHCGRHYTAATLTFTRACSVPATVVNVILNVVVCSSSSLPAVPPDNVKLIPVFASIVTALPNWS